MEHLEYPASNKIITRHAKKQEIVTCNRRITKNLKTGNLGGAVS